MPHVRIATRVSCLVRNALPAGVQAYRHCPGQHHRLSQRCVECCTYRWLTHTATHMHPCMQAFKHVVSALDSASAGVRASAALCVMALTRSVKTLRSSLLESDVADGLCRLLGEPDSGVQVGGMQATQGVQAA